MRVRSAARRRCSQPDSASKLDALQTLRAVQCQGPGNPAPAYGVPARAPVKGALLQSPRQILLFTGRTTAMMAANKRKGKTWV